jgi:hypothetical protein
MMPARVVIVLPWAFAHATDADREAARSLAAGFEREGLPVERIEADRLIAAVRDDDLVVVSAHLGADKTGEEGVALVQALRAQRADLPIIVVGDGDKRAAATDAGATAFISKPAFVKDVVTLGRVLSMPRDGIAPGWGGELDGLHLYYMVRALAAARKTGTLTLTRPTRRGELRFFEGEVTSAAVGALHGQAAFHQLLLWPEAAFDMRLESVVRRQQIPLSPAELLQDAEKFLGDFRELAGAISPASTYEHDLIKAAEHIAEIPKEVGPILRLFDGTRSVADVIEDSPMRFADTLRVVVRLMTLGALKKIVAPRPVRDAGAALQVEDWLVGQSGPEPRRERRSGPHEAVGWGNLARAAAPGAASYAPVVPAHSATGEFMAVGSAPAPPVDGGSKEGADAKTVGNNGKSSSQVRAITPADEKRETGRKSGAHAALKGGRATGSKKAVDKHFEDHEQAFFDQERNFSAEGPAHGDSFADLDEGRPKVGFWQRIFGKAKKKKRKVRKTGTRSAVGKKKK